MSETIKDRILNVDSLLDTYETNLGLPKYQEAYNEDISKYLNLSRVELAALSPIECGEIAFLLSKCSLHITRAINREHGHISWTKSAISELIAKNKYEGYYDAMRNDEVAQKLKKVESWAEIRMERLKYVSNAINRMADLLVELKRSKEKEQERG